MKIFNRYQFSKNQRRQTIEEFICLLIHILVHHQIRPTTNSLVSFLIFRHLHHVFFFPIRFFVSVLSSVSTVQNKIFFGRLMIILFFTLRMRYSFKCTLKLVNNGFSLDILIKLLRSFFIDIRTQSRRFKREITVRKKKNLLKIDVFFSFSKCSSVEIRNASFDLFDSFAEHVRSERIGFWTEKRIEFVVVASRRRRFNKRSNKNDRLCFKCDEFRSNIVRNHRSSDDIDFDHQFTFSFVIVERSFRFDRIEKCSILDDSSRKRFKISRRKSRRFPIHRSSNRISIDSSMERFELLFINEHRRNSSI